MFLERNGAEPRWGTVPSQTGTLPLILLFITAQLGSPGLSHPGALGADPEVVSGPAGIKCGHPQPVGPPGRCLQGSLKGRQRQREKQNRQREK